MCCLWCCQFVWSWGVGRDNQAQSWSWLSGSYIETYTNNCCISCHWIASVCHSAVCPLPMPLSASFYTVQLISYFIWVYAAKTNRPFLDWVIALSLSLIPGQGGRVTAPIRSRQLQRRRGSGVKVSPGQVSLLAWSWVGHWNTRCSTVSSALWHCGQSNCLLACLLDWLILSLFHSFICCFIAWLLVSLSSVNCLCVITMCKMFVTLLLVSEQGAHVAVEQSWKIGLRNLGFKKLWDSKF